MQDSGLIYFDAYGIFGIFADLASIQRGAFRPSGRMDW